ncbi:dihydropteroate synthase [bacterium]|nr:dihydropteroate synthase [bacterium]
MPVSATEAWLCGNRTFELSPQRPFLLGILNVTPDSFSDGGKFLREGEAVRQGIALLEEGDGVDVGGESTRPGAEPVSAKEERARVIPVLKKLRKERPEAFLSVDTYKAEVARAAIGEAGVDVVNDVGAGRWDEEMISVVAGSRVGYVCMHAGGKPREMQKNPVYGDVVADVGEFLSGRLGSLVAAGVERTRVLLDVGIGFGKTEEHNRALLEADWSELGRPLLWGLSRKSFLEATRVEKGMKDREEALDAWNRYLLSRHQPMAWRVHDPLRIRTAWGSR